MRRAHLFLAIPAALSTPGVGQTRDYAAPEVAPSDAEANTAQSLSQRILLLNEAGIAQSREGNDTAALETLAAALETSERELGPRHPLTVQSRSNYASIMLRLGRMKEAEPLLRDVLDVRREVLGPEHPLTLISISNFARLLSDLGRVGESTEYYRELLDLRRKVLGEEHPDTAMARMNYAESLRRLGRVAEADPISEAALQTNVTLHGERDYRTLLSRELRVLIQYDLGRLQEALRLSEQNVASYRAILGDRHMETLNSTNNLVRILATLGRQDEAIDLSAQTLRILRESLGDRHPETLSRMNGHALLLDEAGDYQQSESLAMAALTLRRETLGAKHPQTSQSLMSYGELLASQRRYADAVPFFQEAIANWQQTLGNAHPATVTGFAKYAVLLSLLGNHSEAARIAAQVAQFNLETRGERHPETLESLSTYAASLMEIGRAEEAERMLRDILQIRKQDLGETHPQTLTSLNNHALALRKLRRFDEAQSLLSEAVRLRSEVLGPDHPQTIVALGNRAKTLLEDGRPEQAAELYKQVNRAGRARGLELAGAGTRGQEQEERELGERRVIERFYADALWEAFGGSSAEEKFEALTALQLTSAGSASEAVTEAAAARFAIGKGLSDVVSERKALSREWPAIEAELVKNQLGGNSAAATRKNLSERLNTIESRIVEIDAQLRQTAPEYFAILNQPAVEIDELRSALAENEAMLLLTPTWRGTHAMAVTDGGIEWSRSDWTGSTMAAKVDELRQGLEVTGGGRLPVFDFALAHELYTELIAPVESALEGKKRVYVVADGALSRLPLGVLLAERLEAEAVDAGDAESAADPVRGTMLGGAPSGAASVANDPKDFARAAWLADRYALVNLPSLQSLVFIRTFGLSDADIEGSGYTGFGDPILARHASHNGSRSAGLGGSVDAATMLARGSSNEALMNPASLKQMASLPGTKRELEQVSQLLGASDTSLFLGEAMTEPAIRNADLSKTRILHLATHGLTSEEGGRLGDLAEPGLVFTPPEQSSEADDGYLSASEVVGLNLTLADWVILSACNTAAPSGKAGETGLSGLAQAFFYAGAESLLVSHWPVFDSVAPILTAETLARAQQGTPRAEAFQQAMQAVRETNPHPAAWAPFVLVGEGR